MTEADYTILGENIARLLEGQRAINLRLDNIDTRFGRMLDEQSGLRNEMRRMAENQLIAGRSLEGVRNTISGLRDDLELMIRTEIGGLFAHLETRLENRIAEQLTVRS
jgi:hypothetical protein